MTATEQQRVIVAEERDRLDRMAMRHYGATAGYVEALLRANRGLARLGLYLPRGTRVVAPVLPPPAPQRVRLWA